MYMSKQLKLNLVGVLICAGHLFAGGSGTWQGESSSDYYDVANWSGTHSGGGVAFLPDGNISFIGSPTYTTIERASGSYEYIYGMYFKNTSGSDASFIINGPNRFFIGGSVIRTYDVVSGSLTNVLNTDIFKAGTAENFNIGSNHDLIVNGRIYGGNPLTKSGDGTLTFAGNNNYAGKTEVVGGTLLIEGATSGQGDYTVTNGAALGGSGTIGLNLAKVTICDGSTISPGSGDNIGTLTVSGDFVFSELNKLGSNLVAIPRYGIESLREKIPNAVVLDRVVELCQVLPYVDAFIGGGGTVTIEACDWKVPAVSVRSFLSHYDRYLIDRGMLTQARDGAALSRFLGTISVRAKNIERCFGRVDIDSLAARVLD